MNKMQRLIHIGSLLLGMGVTMTTVNDGRCSVQDAGETARVATALEYVSTKAYEVRYTEFKIRQFVPTNREVPNGAETYTYTYWDSVGMAEIISNYASDIPSVNSFAQQATIKFVGISTSYEYSLQDMRGSAYSGMQLEVNKAKATRRATEARIDELGAVGSAQHGITGMLNQANVTLVTPDTGSWASATPTQILADLRKMQASMVAASKQTFVPDTLLLPLDLYRIVSETEMSVDNDTTILERFISSSPYIKNVDQWYRLDTADAAGTDNRVIMYKRDPEVIELMISQEYETIPPQVVNLAFKVICHARAGGCVVRYPLGMSYMDGC